MVVFNEGKPAVYKQVQTLVEPATEDTFTLTLNKKQMLFLLQVQGELTTENPCNFMSFSEWRDVKNLHFKDTFNLELFTACGYNVTLVADKIAKMEI